MKNEIARREIESLDYYLQNHTDDYSEESHTAMMMAKDALSNADVLDKIKAEIMQSDIYYDNDYFSGNRDPMYKCNEVLQIIDKYKGDKA